MSEVEGELKFPVSPALQERWSGFCAAVRAAAEPFTGHYHLVVPGFYAHELRGFDAELDMRLNEAEQAQSGAFVQDKDGNLFIRLTWTEEVELAA